MCLKGKIERTDCLKSVFIEVRVGWEERKGAGLYRREPSAIQVLKKQERAEWKRALTSQRFAHSSEERPQAAEMTWPGQLMSRSAHLLLKACHDPGPVMHSLWWSGALVK